MTDVRDVRVGMRWPLVGAEQMRALDRHTIEDLSVPGDVLMESAGRAVTERVLAMLAELPSGASVLVVCGAGNNGGDGLVVARHLHVLGVPVRAALLGDPKRLRGDAATNLARAKALGVALEGPRWRAPAAGVLVDAIFGTGLARAVEGEPAAAIRRMNRARGASLRVLAVDLPSGLCADTGQVLGVAVQADATLTIGLPKVGLALEPGRGHAGEIAVARIGIVDEAPGVEHRAELWSSAAAAAALPDRPAAGHKGTFGHALLVAGSEGKTGAAALASEGAARAGAGLVTLACPAGLNDVLEVKCTETMTAPVADTSDRAFAAAALPALLELARERDATGLGPGIGTGAETGKLVRAFVPKLARPLVLDADALNLLAGDPGLLSGRRAATVLTPHPGEASRWLGVATGEINRDRPAAARRLARETGGVVLLKGAATVVADPGGRMAVNPTGGPALASGGTGDVLLGMVTGLVAQGLPAFEAATLAAWLHGAAADRIAARSGPAGLLAGELAREVPLAAEALRRAGPVPAPPDRLALAFP